MSEQTQSDRALATLREIIMAVILETRSFNERKQQAFCRVCRYRGDDRLHDPDCAIYRLHAWLDDEFPKFRARKAQVGTSGEGTRTR